jgi:hypothetical protein
MINLLLAEVLKLVVGLGAGKVVAIGREWKASGRAPVGPLLGVLKVLVSFGVGAVLATWRERKRGEQDRQALTEFRRGIDPDVLQALARWSAQRQLTVERDERTGEILAVSGGVAG